MNERAPHGEPPSTASEEADGARPAPLVNVPDLSLIVVIGVSGSGKTTFASQHFSPTEVVSSDRCRALVSDDENDQGATEAAFEVLHTIVGKRLEAGRLTVVDATNVQKEARRPLIELARKHHVLPVAIVLDVPRDECSRRNADRPDRQFGAHVVRQQHQQLRRSVRGLSREGFNRVFTLRGGDEIDRAAVVRERRWADRTDLTGPFDLIGDIHGCHTELVQLLGELGYPMDGPRVGAHPDGRTVVFVGDLVDRGPGIVEVLRLGMQMVEDGVALCVPGNHENKLGRALNGRKVKINHGLAESLEQLDAQPDAAELKPKVVSFIEGLVSHVVLDDGRLVVAHAGLPENMHMRASGAVRSFCLYGETTGETDEFGLPVRYDWASEYRGSAMVVYGHTPVPVAQWTNGTICIDTGCVFGGNLTALRYPERELVSVPAARVHYEPTRPLTVTQHDGDERAGDLLDIDDVLGKRRIQTRLVPTVTVREENAAAALEVMSRFAIDPHWLIYLPPTMSPCATAPPADDASVGPAYLEHPEQALSYFRREGVQEVVCEEKHMGSRAVVVVCRDEETAASRFGVADGSTGACFTRTGRSFFDDAAMGEAFLDRIRAAVGAAGLWDDLATGWLALDAELMPWSFKAGDLLRRQYAPVGAASAASTAREVEMLTAAVDRGVDASSLLTEAAARQQASARFVDAYRHYCWPVASLDDLGLAPFQVLAAEGQLLAERDHRFHLDLASRLAAADPVLIRETPHRFVTLADRDAVAEVIAWWEHQTSSGVEGMVVKPVDAIVRSPSAPGIDDAPEGDTTDSRERPENDRRPAPGGLVQPGVKCRGRDYLRIIYGPDYDAEVNLRRLRKRHLGHKRSLALREFALGIEALDRFVHGEALWRVHECVFAVLALESEPVDPRL